MYGGVRQHAVKKPFLALRLATALICSTGALGRALRPAAAVRNSGANSSIAAPDADLALGAAREPKSAAATTGGVFVSVFSKRDHFDQRAAFRDAWRAADIGPDFVLRFALCFGDDEATLRVRHESAFFGDVLFSSCAEGNGRGQLTIKTLQFMELYNQKYAANHSLYLQLEDDTFVAWRRLRAKISEKSVNDQEHAYMGVQVLERHTVERNPDSPWFQPDTEYLPETYPIYMERSGYLLGKTVVQTIIDSKIAESHLLSNHDQAVGVWVDMAKRSGEQVKFTKLSGRRLRRSEPSDVCSMTWRDFPFVLYHGINFREFACLQRLDVQDAIDKRLDSCLFDCGHTRSMTGAALES